MTAIAPTLQAFFTERLARQRGASPRTIASYRDTLRLLLAFARAHTGKQPAALDWDDLNAATISAFLDHLEASRGNSPRTRNLRLTAIRSLIRWASLRHPEHAATFAQVLAIPPKRADKRTITFLLPAEAQALIDTPDQARWEGRRDRALIVLALQAGLRVSELTGLDCGDIIIGTGGHVRCEGKGRKERAVPLTRQAQAVLREWITERAGAPRPAAVPGQDRAGLSRDAVEHRLRAHAAAAAKTCPSLKTKSLHPHVLRHSCAMALLSAGVDATVIALWLGHADIRSTQAYLHADLSIKERALALTTPASVKPGRYKPPDRMLAFLESL